MSLTESANIIAKLVADDLTSPKILRDVSSLCIPYRSLIYMRSLMNCCMFPCRIDYIIILYKGCALLPPT